MLEQDLRNLPVIKNCRHLKAVTVKEAEIKRKLRWGREPTQARSTKNNISYTIISDLCFQRILDILNVSVKNFKVGTKTLVYLVMDGCSIVLEMIPKMILGLCVKESLDRLVMPGHCRRESGSGPLRYTTLHVHTFRHA